MPALVATATVPVVTGGPGFRRFSGLPALRLSMTAELTARTPSRPGEMWDIDRLCLFLGVSEHFVYRLTSERRPHIRTGKQPRFDPRDVAEYLDPEMVEIGSGEPMPTRRPGVDRH